MNIAVRYYSKSGNTKRIAEAIAEGSGTHAVSITDEPTLSERIDILFLGGAPYANVMAPELRRYAECLVRDRIGKVVLFTTSNWSHRTVKGLQKILQAKGIPVAEGHFYAHMLNISGKLDAAREFGRKYGSNNCLQEEKV